MPAIIPSGVGTFNGLFGKRERVSNPIIETNISNTVPQRSVTALLRGQQVSNLTSLKCGGKVKLNCGGKPKAKEGIKLAKCGKKVKK